MNHEGSFHILSLLLTYLLTYARTHTHTHTHTEAVITDSADDSPYSPCPHGPLPESRPGSPQCSPCYRSSAARVTSDRPPWRRSWWRRCAGHPGWKARRPQAPRPASTACPATASGPGWRRSRRSSSASVNVEVAPVNPTATLFQP